MIIKGTIFEGPVLIIQTPGSPLEITDCHFTGGGVALPSLVVQRLESEGFDHVLSEIAIPCACVSDLDRVEALTGLTALLDETAEGR